MPRSDGAAFRSTVLSEPPKIAAGRALIASARNYSGKGRAKLKATARASQVQAEGWNRLAWEFYDSVTEYHYAVSWVGNLLSRAKLVLKKDGEPCDEETPLGILHALYGGPAAQSEMLRQYGIHLTVAGDSYLIGAIGEDGEEDWFVAAATEVQRSTDGGWTIAGEEFARDTFVMRLWKAHPQKRQLADSPTRAALPILSEIDALTKHVAAQIDSRLASAGILFVPNEMSFGTVKVANDDDPEADDDDPPAAQTRPDELVRELIEIAMMALEDRSSAAALVPPVIQAPGEFIDKVKHLTLWSPLEEKAKEMREEAIRRLALGLDMPPEALTGTGEMNHWNAWQMDEAGIKAHTEPLLNVIVTSLTLGFLRPTLAAEDGFDAETASAYSIGVDTTALRVRPNRSKEAVELNDRMLLSDEAVIRENGFEPSDAMGEEERAAKLLQKTALATPTPNMVLAALRALGVPGLEEIPDEATNIREQVGDPDGNGGSGENRTPSLDGHPSHDPPETPNDGHPRNNDHEAASILTASSVLVLRALERAGNKIKSKVGGSVPGVPARELYLTIRPDFGQTSLDFLMHDAWGFVPEVAGSHGIDADWLTATLDSYTRALLTEGAAHTTLALAHHIADATVR